MNGNDRDMDWSVIDDDVVKSLLDTIKTLSPISYVLRNTPKKHFNTDCDFAVNRIVSKICLNIDPYTKKVTHNALYIMVKEFVENITHEDLRHIPTSIKLSEWDHTYNLAINLTMLYWMIEAKANKQIYLII
jgi:hypothetical protein